MDFAGWQPISDAGAERTGVLAGSMIKSWRNCVEEGPFLSASDTAGCAPVRLERVREAVLPMKMHFRYDAEIVVQVGEVVTLVCALVREALGSATI